MMRVIVVTSATNVPGEAQLIEQLLRGGIDRVHLRKPQASEAEFRQLIEAIPDEFYPQLSTHDHLEMAVEYGLGGVHLNGRNPRAPQGFGGLVSRSCHSIAELEAATNEDYLFLSPIFDSISKEGYASAFSDTVLRQAAITQRVIALGGVTPQHFAKLREYGFGGAAMLGSIWSEPTPEAVGKQIDLINKFR